MLYAIRSLDKLRSANDDQKVGIEIVRRALQSPVRQIAERSGRAADEDQLLRTSRFQQGLCNQASERTRRPGDQDALRARAHSRPRVQESRLTAAMRITPRVICS